MLPGALQFLEDVKSSGRKLALGSASKNARRILEKVEIVELFDAIIDGTKVYKGKPDPQTFLFGAEATDTHPSECVVIEDSVAGIEAGIAAGSYTLGIGKEKTLKRASIVIPGFEKHGIEILEEF
jgi:beta-phosphoglucomutase